MKEKRRKLKRRIRRSTLFFLVLALITNSFAWFIYTNKVSNSINTHVKSWMVTFDQDGNPLEDTVEFNIDSIYPGMNDFNDSITISNTGETTAYISYEVDSIKILDEVYTKDNYSSDELINMLKDKYPFTITFDVINQEITTGSEGSFNVKLVWPYESGDDEADTYWGRKSYEFMENNKDEKSVSIVVKIKASQNRE